MQDLLPEPTFTRLSPQQSSAPLLNVPCSRLAFTCSPAEDKSTTPTHEHAILGAIQLREYYVKDLKMLAFSAKAPPRGAAAESEWEGGEAGVFTSRGS